MKKIILLIVMIGALVLSVNREIKAEEPIEQVAISKQTASINVYFPRLPDFNLTNEKIDLENNMLNEEKIKVIIDRLSKGSEKANIIDVIPNGSRLNNVYVEEKTAFVDFSKEFVDNHPGGSLGEYNTIYSIVNSITELDGIENVVFLIDGEKQETYKGHCQFDIPIYRDESLIVME